MMKRLRSTLAAAFCCGLLFSMAGLVSGCHRTLAPNGVYNGDKILFEADNAIVQSHALLQDFVTWEANNRDALAKWPEIRKAADTIVKDGPSWFMSANALIEAYKADPSASNRDKLQTALGILKTAVTEAATHYLKLNPNGVMLNPPTQWLVAAS